MTRWKREDKIFLRKNWGLMTGPEIAEKLNRTEDSIYWKASKLGLRVKDRQGVSCREAEDISGFNKGTVLKIMIESGITDREWKRLSPNKIEKLVENHMQYETLSSVCKRHNMTKYEMKKVIDRFRVNNYSETKTIKLRTSEIDEAVEKYKKKNKR